MSTQWRPFGCQRPRAGRRKEKPFAGYYSGMRSFSCDLRNRPPPKSIGQALIISGNL